MGFRVQVKIRRLEVKKLRVGCQAIEGFGGIQILVKGLGEVYVL